MKYLVLLIALMMPCTAWARVETATITVDGLKCLDINNNYIDSPVPYYATVDANGTWGGGTITWTISYDGGTTFSPVKDLTGVSVTSSANDNFPIELGRKGYPQTVPQLCATMAGSTTPSVTVRLMDNN